jgi:hypothetical protein
LFSPGGQLSFRVEPADRAETGRASTPSRVKQRELAYIHIYVYMPSIQINLDARLTCGCQLRVASGAGGTIAPRQAKTARLIWHELAASASAGVRCQRGRAGQRLCACWLYQGRRRAERSEAQRSRHMSIYMPKMRTAYVYIYAAGLRKILSSGAMRRQFFIDFLSRSCYRATRLPKGSSRKAASFSRQVRTNSILVTWGAGKSLRSLRPEKSDARRRRPQRDRASAAPWAGQERT